MGGGVVVVLPEFSKSKLFTLEKYELKINCCLIFACKISSINKIFSAFFTQPLFQDVT